MNSLDTLGYILVFSILGGVVSLIGGALLLRSKKSAEKLAKYATPFAAGALLAAVFLDLLKEGIETSETYIVLMMTLVGILIFFFLERFLTWFHHHHSHDGHDDKKDPKMWLVIIGDTLHNALDGVAIAASFLVSVPTGIVTTIAVAAHEIPQEVGDFGVLLKKGMRRRDVLLVNFMSALATVAAALLAYLFGTSRPESIGILFGLSAGFLLYIALSDLIPEIHESSPKRRLLDWQPILLLLGVLTVAVSVNVAHKYIDPSHDDMRHQDCFVTETGKIQGSCAIDSALITTDENGKQQPLGTDAGCVSYYDKDGKKLLALDCPGDNQDLDAFPLEDDDHSSEHEGQSEHGY